MASQANIKTLMQALVDDVNERTGETYSMRREDQTGPKAEYPYLHYKAIINAGRPAQGDGVSYAEKDPVSETEIDKIIRTVYTATLSLSFADNDGSQGHLRAQNGAKTALAAVKGKFTDAARAMGFVVVPVDSVVTDRTAYLDDVRHEPRFGFDLYVSWEETETTTVLKADAGLSIEELAIIGA